MALIKTLAEIRDVLPKLVSMLSANSALPNFERAEYKYIVPLIGTALYNDLSTKYNGAPDTTSTDEKVLIKKMRLIIAAYAFRDELGIANLMIGDTGARKLTQGGADRVYGWEYAELKNTLLLSAMDGIDVLLNYLWDNKGSWALWTASDQYKKYTSLLIKDGTDFNDQYTLFQPQRSWWTMRSVMSDVQELYLQEGIGKALLIYLRDVAGPSDDEIECIRLLKKSLAFLTVYQSCKHFSVSFSEDGFTIVGQKTNSTIEPGATGVTELSLLEMKMCECERQGNDFLAKARNTLVAVYAAASVDYKAAFDAGTLKDYVQPSDRTSGNEGRKIYTF